jgi:hypothetical protein
MGGTRVISYSRSGGLTRRDALKSALLASGAAAASSFPAPFVHAADPIVIRYAGTGVNAFREISEKVKEDLGIELQYTTLTSDDVVKRAITQPTSFDLLDSEYWMLAKIVPSGNLKGMDSKKVSYTTRLSRSSPRASCPTARRHRALEPHPSRSAISRARKATSSVPSPLNT